MSVILEDLSIATARVLIARAAANGLTVEEYLQQLLGISPEGQRTAFDTHPDEGENAFLTDMEALAEETEHLPALSMNYSREDIYFDHD